LHSIFPFPKIFNKIMKNSLIIIVILFLLWPKKKTASTTTPVKNLNSDYDGTIHHTQPLDGSIPSLTQPIQPITKNETVAATVTIGGSKFDLPEISLLDSLSQNTISNALMTVKPTKSLDTS